MKEILIEELEIKEEGNVIIYFFGEKIVSLDHNAQHKSGLLRYTIEAKRKYILHDLIIISQKSKEPIFLEPNFMIKLYSKIVTIMRDKKIEQLL